MQKEERKEADIEETDTQRRKQANKALWKKRTPTTITIGTEYRKTNKNRETQIISEEKGGRRQAQNSTKCTRIRR